MSKKKILVVEDDRSIADVLVYNLEQEGYETFVARDGQDGLTQARLKLPEIIILDLMLPVVDGRDVCRELRADSTTKDTLIVVLTAKSEESDQIVGFSLGADDYVTKPFSVKVLLERIKALLRRKSTSVESDDVIVSQGMMIDRHRHRATIGDRALDLTRSEFRMLDTLLRQPGRVFSRAELIDAALNEDTQAMERTVDVHIRGLRRKLGNDADMIETVRGVGYRFRDPQAAVLE